MSLASRRCLVTAFVFLVAPDLPLPAQSLRASRAVEMVAENDLFLPRGGGAPPDYDYTHGTRTRVTWGSAPSWVAALAAAASSCRTAAARTVGCVVGAIGLTQDIYTPRRDGIAPVAGERPYAGWLYLTATARRVAPRVTRSLDVVGGVTGHPSLAEDAQMDIHHLVRTGPQLGWRHQLAARGTLGIRYGETRRFERLAPGSRSLAARLRWDATAGNAVDALSAGGDVELASRSDAPWSPAMPDVAHPPRLYMRLGAGGDAVLRDVFLEGWRRGSAATRRAFVAQGEAAVGARWRRWAVEYRAVMRGPEYRAAPSPHPYGSFRLTVDGY